MKQTLKTLFGATVTAAVALTSQPGQAAVVISNFGEPYVGTDGISATHWETQGFVTGANNDSWSLLSSIAIRYSSPSSPSYVGQLFLGNPQFGGTLLNVMTFDTAAGGIATFKPSGAVTLAPSTEYWFVLGLTGGIVNWDAATTKNSTGPGGFPSPYGWGTSENSGATWNTVYDWLPQYIEVTGVPEPSTIATGVIAALGAGGVWLRQRRKA